MSSSRLLLLAIGLMLGGCSVYPLPQDTTGFNTSDIVDNIRCEARDGIRETVLSWLKDRAYAQKPVWQGMTGEMLAYQLETGRIAWYQVPISELEPDLRRDFDFFKNSQIAYEFTLNMEESNINTADLGLVGNFLSRRRDALALSGSTTQKRTTIRSFNVVDSFAELGRGPNTQFCDRPRRINIVYPITGRLPIRDLISSYVQTNQFAHLAGPGTDVTKIVGTEASPAIPQMGDTIMFTTKLAGSVNPTFVLNPTGLGYLLNSAGFNTDNYRQDMHQVIVVVSTSPDVAKLSRFDPNRLRSTSSRSDFLANSRFMRVPRGRGDRLTDAKVAYGIESLNAQRQKNFEDAIIQLGTSISGALR